MTDIEARVRAGLAEIAAGVDPAADPATAAVATGRALRTRRARRTQALVAVVAAGLLTTIGVLAHDSAEKPTGSSGIATAPSTSPQPTPTGSSGTSPAPGATTTVSPALAAWLTALRVGPPEATPTPNPASLRYAGGTYVPQTNDPPPPILVAPTSRGWLAIFIPDGFTGAPDPNTVLGLLTPPTVTGQPWTLTPLATGVIAGAAVSPDGTEVAYARVNSSTFDGPVIVRDLATGAVRATSPTLASARVLGWGPDGVVAGTSSAAGTGWALKVWAPGQSWRSVADVSGPGALDGQAAASAPEVLVLPPATNGEAPCAEVLRLTATATPTRLWRGCGPQAATAGALSPNGRWVLTNSLALVNVATGASTPLAPAAVGTANVASVRWQDDYTVTVRIVYSSSGATTTLQCTVSGSCMLAGPVLPPHPAAGTAAASTAGANAIADYLRDWAAHGPAAAAATYLVPDQQIPPGQQVPAGRLVTGWVSDPVLTSWVSTEDFTLRVTLVLHFSTGAPWAAWGEGANTRIVHVTKAAGATGYRLSLATGP